MLPVILAALLGAGGSGSAPPVLQPGMMGGDFYEWEVGKPKGSLEAPRAGTLERLHRDINTAGTDDGAGPDSFTLAVTVNGVAVCSESILCTTTGSATTTCTASFAAGDAVHLEVTAEDCGTLPKFVASAQWSW